MEERYSGTLWHEESVAEQIDPRLKRTDENRKQLDELKAKIYELIVLLSKEFDAASKKEDTKKAQNDPNS